MEPIKMLPEKVNLLRLQNIRSIHKNPLYFYILAVINVQFNVIAIAHTYEIFRK